MAGQRRSVVGSALLALVLLLAACADPERVRLAETPSWPPLMPPKPSAAPAAGRAVTPTVAPVPSLPPVAPAVPTTATVRPPEESYRVQRGDTLFSISQRFGVPLAAMISANGLEAPFELAVGQQLTLPAVRVHEVQRGETLYSIAGLHGLDAAELAQANRLEAPYSLWTGRRLVVPGPVGEGPAQEVDVTIAEAAAAAEPAGGELVIVPLPGPDSELQPLPPGEAPGEAPGAPPQEAAEEVSTPAPAPAVPEEETRPSPPPQVTAVPAPPPRAGGRFLWPLQGALLARFGPQGDGRHNDGINIAAERGAEVRAAENGVVAYAGNELRGFGNLLLIKHADDWITAYAHNDELLVSAGQAVTRGQPIARVGATGSVGRPQLHFEIRKGTRAIDPLPLLDGAGG